MNARSDRLGCSCGRPKGTCGSPGCVTRSPCEPDPIGPAPHLSHTESNDREIEVSEVMPTIGTIPLRDYLTMVAPGAILIQKREVHWMLFVVFLAGGIVGSLLHKLLA
jgi:hypothetical protein